MRHKHDPPGSALRTWDALCHQTVRWLLYIMLTSATVSLSSAGLLPERRIRLQRFGGYVLAIEEQHVSSDDGRRSHLAILHGDDGDRSIGLEGACRSVNLDVGRLDLAEDNIHTRGRLHGEGNCLTVSGHREAGERADGGVVSGVAFVCCAERGDALIRVVAAEDVGDGDAAVGVAVIALASAVADIGRLPGLAAVMGAE